MRTAAERTAAARTLLDEQVQKLTGTHLLPVDVERVVRTLGLPPVEVREDARRRAHGVLRSSSTGHNVVVFRKHKRAEHRLSPSERVTVAHEIGHFIVERELSFRPQRTSEYWELERCCDEFARMLLLPAAAIASLVAEPPRSAAQLLNHVRQLSRKAEVPTGTTSNQLLLHWKRGAMVALRETVERRDAVRAAVWWSIESEPLFGLRSRTHLRHGHPLAAIVAEHAQTGLGELREQQLDGLDFASLRTGPQSILVAAFPTHVLHG
jgi:IrrE N-terminal-like domain